MGCGGSKVDDFRLVTLCKERKEFIKAASEHRYALAAAHVSYFQSLKVVGDALRKFVDEELSNWGRFFAFGFAGSDIAIGRREGGEEEEDEERRRQ
ncbi:hypothetical protein L1049_026824 [Liquidambar formosana]|uniref:DUF630 domain-containing protein n=1 Tax=Liquidambar formosana TaxID=63359 RepID=A0AAP0NHR5_LIQFO